MCDGGTAASARVRRTPIFSAANAKTSESAFLLPSGDPELTNVELVQLLPVRPPRVRRVVRAGCNLPPLCALRPPVVGLVDRQPASARPRRGAAAAGGTAGRPADARRALPPRLRQLAAKGPRFLRAL